MRMFSPCWAVIPAAIVFTSPCGAASTGEIASAKVRQAAAAMDAAWDRADPAAMAALFADEATIQAGPNSVLEGRAAIHAFFKRDFDTRPALLRHVSELRRVDMITPDLALVDKVVRIEQQDSEGRWEALRTFLNATIMKRVTGVWKVRAVRAHVIPN
ncbi:SgcJ/EcaC family oxidoreductase [Sphingomonas sp. ID1715]|uniref:YybH family protein n=1 Tax=Sphingomonas sp. ID1715 TaxID=1656898 RepID=UPI0014883C25|nr:SgcJ/EcaC family oxidoreductase [Sphingomonas sp. ID1715]NNM78037.1 SgcJ/EcaC family oxidoreductase [Sphingomonas sp. ID1715]